MNGHYYKTFETYCHLRGVPVRNISIKVGCLRKHFIHTRHLRGVPVRNISIKLGCIFKHPSHNRHARGVPVRNISIKVGCTPNIPPILVTLGGVPLEIFHKGCIAKHFTYIVVTLEVSQLEISPLKLDAPET